MPGSDTSDGVIFSGLLLLAYLLGSIPWGLILSRFFAREDIRLKGSGNIGATNVGRILGIKWGILCFLLDVGKGLLPVLWEMFEGHPNLLPAFFEADIASALAGRGGPVAGVEALFGRIPAGVGRGGAYRFNTNELRRLMRDGSPYLLARGLATESDIEHTEAGGKLPGADPGLVSERAFKRGSDQCGTLGSGNHYLEVQKVVEIYHAATARTVGIQQGDLRPRPLQRRGQRIAHFARAPVADIAHGVDGLARRAGGDENPSLAGGSHISLTVWCGRRPAYPHDSERVGPCNSDKTGSGRSGCCSGDLRP